MFKLNKSTHMLILMTFTIVFVVVYMYYMIRDVKKIYAEVNKHGQDIASLQKVSNEIQEIKNVIASLSAPTLMTAEPIFMPPFPPQPIHPSETHCQIPSAAPVATVKETEPKEDTHEDDIASTTTEDIKKLVEGVDDADEPSVEEQVNQLTEEQVKKMKFEEIKDLCKKFNISTKGTKESLAAKILEHIK